MYPCYSKMDSQSVQLPTLSAIIMDSVSKGTIQCYYNVYAVNTVFKH